MSGCEDCGKDYPFEGCGHCAEGDMVAAIARAEKAEAEREEARREAEALMRAHCYAGHVWHLPWPRGAQGAELPVIEEGPAWCPRCGREHPDEDWTCLKCGAHLVRPEVADQIRATAKGGVPALTVREAARQRRALDGVDAQALEGALSLTEAERDIANAAAVQIGKDHGETLAKLEKAEAEREEARGIVSMAMSGLMDVRANNYAAETGAEVLRRLEEFVANWPTAQEAKSCAVRPEGLPDQFANVMELREWLGESMWLFGEAFGADRSCMACAKVFRHADRRELGTICVRHGQWPTPQEDESCAVDGGEG